MCIISLPYLKRPKSSRILGPIIGFQIQSLEPPSYILGCTISGQRKSGVIPILLVIYVLVPIIPDSTILSFLHSLVTLGVSWPHQIDHYRKLLPCQSVKVVWLGRRKEHLLEFRGISELIKPQHLWRTQWWKFSSLAISQYILYFFKIKLWNTEKTVLLFNS